MSWYTTYYAGYRDKKTGKIHCLGPYGQNRALYALMSTSASFTSDLKDRFYPIGDDELGEDLLKDLGKDWDQDEDNIWVKELRQYLGYLPLSELGSRDFMRSGYCLNEQIDEYEREGSEWYEFYPVLTPKEYIRKLHAEQEFGIQTTGIDEDGYEYLIHPCRDYSYYVYPDYCCKEYDAFKLGILMDIFEFYPFKNKDAELVIIKTEG